MLLLVLVVLLLGLAGIFLPILPGIFLIGIAVALYTLILKSDKSQAIHHIHPYLKAISKRTGVSLNPDFFTMSFLRKKTKNLHDIDEVLKHGLILAGLNILMTLAFIFSLGVITNLLSVFKLEAIASGFSTLILIFIFAAISAVMWYRYGQILGQHLYNRRAVNAALTVVLSVLPLLGILVVLVTFLQAIPIVPPAMAATTLLGFIYISVLAAVFELLLVTIGVVTKK